MPYQVITSFNLGLDKRKFFLNAPSGSLTSLVNAHIDQGGDIEKRKAFVNVPIPFPYTSNVFGFQPSQTGIYLFGAYTIQAPALQRSRTSNVATLYLPRGTVAAQSILGNTPNINVTNAGGQGYNLKNVAVTGTLDDGTYVQITYASVGPDEALTFDLNARVIRVSDVIASPFNYQVIIHPSYRASGAGSLAPTCTGIVSSTLFGDFPYVIAKFSDGSVLPFYNGECLPDSFIGLEFLGSDGNANSLLDSINDYIGSSVPAYTSAMGGSGILNLFSIPTTLNGTPFTVTKQFSSINGTLSVAQQITGQASTAATQSVGSFQIISAGAGTQATGTLTNTADTNLNDGDTVTVATITYQFKNTMAAAYDVKIGASRDITLANLAAAINASGVAGTNYFAGTLVNPSVKCSALNNTTATGPTTHYTLALAAITGGTAGNSLALSSTASTRLAASAATLTGGVDSQINQIVINGATNLLSSAVAFTANEASTAAAVVAAINSNVASGYQATANDATVTILPQTADATHNGFAIQVQSQGTIVCGTGAFTLTGSGFTLDYCKANGVDLMNNAAPYMVTNTTVLQYPLVPGQVLADFCRVVANSINSGTATHGYLAHCPKGSVSLYICKATTTSTDAQQVLDIGVTPAGGTGAALPVDVNVLSASLDTNALAIGAASKSGAVTVSVSGGVQPYIYRWSQDGTNVSGIKINSPKSAQTTFSSSVFNTAFQQQLRTYQSLPPAQQPAYLASHPALAAYLQATSTNQAAFKCTVTDALGQVAVTDDVFVTILTR